MSQPIASVHQMPREIALEADTVITYQLDEGEQAGMTVVEVLNAHRLVIARSITAADGTREDVADLTLHQSSVERCSNWAIDPIGKRKRSTAMLSVRMSNTTASLDALRERHQIGA